MRSFVNLKSNKSHFDLIFNFRCPGWGEEHYTSNFLQRLYLHIFFVKWLLICSILFCFELDFSPFTEYVTSNSCLVIISIHSTRNSFCSINILFFSYSVNSAFASKNKIMPESFWSRNWNSPGKKWKKCEGLDLKVLQLKWIVRIKKIVAVILDIPANQHNQWDSTYLLQYFGLDQMYWLALKY